MAKKIFDIFPPKPKAPIREEKPILKKKKFFPKVAIFFPLFLIMVGIFFHFVLAKAEILIWPETEILNFQERVNINSEIKQIDLAGKNIPGKIFEEEREISEDFPSSGKVLKKAEGKIRVYNAYSTSPQVLMATTRFVSAEGKLFRTPEKVTIPGGHYEKGKLVPGFADILVRADQPGAEYNIGPTTFSIPGFAGTARYTAIYGKSFSAMTGGGERPQVSQEDLEKAKNILVEKLKKESRESLRTKISGDFILLDEGISQEIVEASSPAQPGAEVEKFNFKVKIKSAVMVFKKSDLEKFAQEFLSLNIPEDKEIQKESLKISYSPQSANLKEGKINLNLDFSAKIFVKIDFISLKKALLEKSLKEAQIVLGENPKITQVELKVFPFWLKKIPSQEEKIKIELRVD